MGKLRTNISKILKDQKDLITKFIKVYNSKIDDVIESEGSSLDELNKISTLLAKNIPEIIKLQNTIQNSENKKLRTNKFIEILPIIRKDEQANQLLQKLLFRISEITEVSTSIRN